MNTCSGDVVVARFFSDKARPGVVIGNDAYLRALVMICPMTTNLAGGALRIPIKPDVSGLQYTSEIMPHRLQSLPPERIAEQVGCLPTHIMNRLEDVLLDLLGLESACSRLLG